MTVQNTHRSYLGIAKETTKGTPVTPTDFIPVLASKLKPVDIYMPLFDEGLRGSLVKNYNYVQGRGYSTFDWGGPVFPDTIGYTLGGLLGDVATTGASAPYTHVIALKNASATGADAQPTAFTLTDFYAAQVRAYAGVQVHDFSLKFTAEGLLDYDAKGTGWNSATATTPTPSFSAVTPIQTWQATVTIAGTTVSNAVDGNIDMKRTVTPVFGIAATQNPYQIFLGALEVTGKISFVMENDNQLTNFLTNTQPSVNINWSYGTGATAVQLMANITKGAYTAAVIERSKEFVQVTIDLNALGNTTDAGASSGYSPIKWTLKNAKTSGTYQ